MSFYSYQLSVIS